MFKRHGEEAGDQALLQRRDDPPPARPTSREPAPTAPAEAPASLRAPAREEKSPLEAPNRPRPEADERPSDDQKESGPARKRSLLRRPLALFSGLVVALLVAAAGYLYLDNSRRFESTDDAFIAARNFAIAPKVSGYIVAVPVTDNQHVAAGDVIARIDDRDYRVALAQADAQVAAAQASIQNIDAQIAVQQAQVEQSQAQVEQAQAGLVFAQQQASRYEDLAQRGAGSVQNAQQYSSSLRQQQATLKTAQAAVTAAERQVAALKAQRETAEANLSQAKAQHEQAQLNLSYTTIAAAQPGRIVNLTAAVGQFAAAGTNLTMFVPDEIWVDANFKETQLDAMRPGQPVEMTIDAYPERVLHGHVGSVQPGSGPAFSLLPPENATGNYVKIVQRVPVKIVFDDPPKDVALGPGMSVVPTVRVDPTPSLYERLKAWL
jgi:membrane fusion protein (multidrug efflux system)